MKEKLFLLELKARDCWIAQRNSFDCFSMVFPSFVHLFLFRVFCVVCRFCALFWFSGCFFSRSPLVLCLSIVGFALEKLLNWHYVIPPATLFTAPQKRLCSNACFCFSVLRFMDIVYTQYRGLPSIHQHSTQTLTKKHSLTTNKLSSYLMELPLRCELLLLLASVALNTYKKKRKTEK